MTRSKERTRRKGMAKKKGLCALARRFSPRSPLLPVAARSPSYRVPRTPKAVKSDNGEIRVFCLGIFGILLYLRPWRGDCALNGVDPR
jgi:hypothetical protein